MPRAAMTAASMVLAFALLGAEHARAQSFEETLSTAYRTNPRLMAERERVAIADEDLVQARALGRFTSGASLDVAPTLVRIPNSQFAPPGVEVDGTSVEYITTRQAGAQIIQPLYQGGRVKYSKRQAKAGILSARATLDSVEQDLLLRAAEAHADVVQAADAAAIRRRNVGVLLRQREAAQVRFDVGTGTRTDIALADSRTALARIQLSQSEAALASARAVYESVVGIPPLDLGPVPDIAIPASQTEAGTIASASNPQLLASRFREESADAAIGIARAAGKPTVSLNGSVGAIREGLGGLTRAETASVTASVTVPITSGGANRSRVRQAKAARNLATFQTRDLERTLRAQVAQLYAAIAAANESIRQSRVQVSAAEIAFEGVELEQEVGTRTALDVLDAEQELAEARLRVTDAERELQRATFQLLAVLGAFDSEALGLPVAAFDPDGNLQILDIDSTYSDTQPRLGPPPASTILLGE